MTEFNPNHKPNFVLIITDQSRIPGMHWPPGFTEEYLPSFNRLQQKGLTFKQAHIAASMCSPSRACLFTGTYENINGVQTVVSQVTGEQLHSASELPNLATMLNAVGYDVIYKGKWDMTEPWEKMQQDGQSEQLIQKMKETYGFAEWNPPDAGIALGFPLNSQVSDFSLSTLGGGIPNNDGRFVSGTDADKVCKNGQEPGTGCQTPGYGESVLDYLKKVGQTSTDKRKPFFLVVSLANPHDIGFYPNGYNLSSVDYPKSVDLGIDLPNNFNDPLTTKPTIQTTYREILETASLTEEQQIGYVNFYAYLYKVVDQHIMAVLDALDSNKLTNDTIIIRLGDHGELGLSHKLTEKCYTIYKEVVNVPLIFSNPVIFPEKQETNALWSHVDLVATVAELAGAEPIGVGVSQVPVLKNPQSEVRDSVVFAMDDQFGSKIPLTTDASHIRALIDRSYTYAVYFTASYAGTAGNSEISVTTPYQLELYDKQKDPDELNNLLWQPDSSIESLWEKLHLKLTTSMQDMGNMPSGWPTTLEELKKGVKK